MMDLLNGLNASAANAIWPAGSGLLSALRGNARSLRVCQQGNTKPDHLLSDLAVVLAKVDATELPLAPLSDGHLANEAGGFQINMKYLSIPGGDYLWAS